MTYQKYKVKGEQRYVIKLNEFTNGVETTGGLYREEELKEVDDVISITYDSEHATELPVQWKNMFFLDDNNKVQKIKRILYDSAPAYEMEDGFYSYEVTV